MITLADSMPVVGTIGGGFFVGLVAGYAIKKIIKIAAVIIGLFIAALAYMQYQRIIDVNWEKIQAVSQNGLTSVANTAIHISNNIGAGHTGGLSNLGIPLAASASAGFALGMVLICQKGSQYLVESCANLLNPDGSLTARGDTAVGCIRNGFAAAILGTKLGLSFDQIKGALEFAAGPSGCGGIVDLNQIQNSPDFQSLLASVPGQ